VSVLCPGVALWPLYWRKKRWVSGKTNKNKINYSLQYIFYTGRLSKQLK
jgi:hypothetical protein